MKTVQLGTSGLDVSELGFGTMGLSGVYGAADDDASIATLHRAVDLGVTFFDTADIYGDGHNERLVGRALAAHRTSLVLATKFGGGTEPDGEIRGLARPERVGPFLRESLARLGTDYVDLYYLHRADPATPIEETVGAMADLVHQGLVRHLGLSEVSGSTLRRAHAVHPIAALQTEYSLFGREAEREALPTARELGVGFVAYSPLGRGFLGGVITSADDVDAADWRASVPRYQGDSLTHALELTRILGSVADSLGATPNQVALAWLFDRGDTVVPIPGTRRIEHLESNVRAAAVHLSGSVRHELELMFPVGVLAADRMPPDNMRRVDL
jgi:aryl-alcohol dehydrogenase-like predicted oxidoreductase